ncbi:Putative undecaprenyl-diphosphatase YbjG [Thalassocella blandensis]|nr:Putative undecaprenyl-diphosphatase YbjG [Thalassocella blandensis]
MVKHKVIGLLRWIGNREFAALLAVFTILFLVWGFAELSEEVMEGETMTFDEAVLLSMRNPQDVSDPLGPGWFEEMGRDVTAMGGNVVLTILTLAVCGFMVLDGKRRLAIVLIVATLGALGVSTMLKSSFDRDRPDLVPHDARVYTASFPSGHSMLAASTYLTLGALLARAQKRRRIKAYILIISLFLTLIIGLSRIYLGVHWPTDVLGGWAVGAGWALGCWLLARWLQDHGEVENEYGRLDRKEAVEP